jgi:dipeptidase D
MIDQLEPEILWKYFSEISSIPRQSKHEERIIEYLENFAKERNLNCLKDSAGNIVISKNAVPGKESSPVVVLQSHVDMVCEKNEGTVHDFLKDPLKLYIDNGFVRAEGTTLGADDGIGVAAALAVLDSSDISHGPVECLFTVDEETGLTGANALGEDFVKGRMLLNLDSEEEGAICIGCAGGKTTSLSKTGMVKVPNTKELTCRIVVDGLKGGHSGIEINSGRGNAVILLARFLWNLNKMMNFELAEINGGDKHNAIPREASAVITYLEEDSPILETKISKYTEIFKSEFKKTDGGIRIIKSNTDKAVTVFEEKDKSSILNLLYSFPHGVQAMSADIKGLVETSTNLASVKSNGSEIHILSSQRSSVESAIHDIAGKVIAHALLADFDYLSKDPYPAWTPNPDSPLLKKAVKVHSMLFGKEPKVKAIHAGLECGIIGRKYPGMDMISFGPDVEGAHSPEERVRIESAGNFWKYLKNILEEL